MITTGLVALLYFTIFAGHFAHATELDSILPDDHNHERLLDTFTLARNEGVGEEGDADVIYQAEFEGAGEELHGRQLPMAYEIPNNIARPYNVNQGETLYLVFTNSSVWGEQSPSGSGSTGLPSVGLSRRWEDEVGGGEQGASNTGDGDDEESSIHKRANATRTVYITLNTCLQPDKPKGDNIPKEPPAQVTMYIGDNQTALGADQPADGQRIIVPEFGFANLTIEASQDIYIAVSGPNSTEYGGPYNVKVGVSIDAPFHAYSGDNADLFFIDSDSNSALLATKNLTLDSPGTEVYNKWMNLSPPPYVIFATNQNKTLIQGVSRSYCGLQYYSQIAGTRENEVKTIMTNVTLGTYPKQQFYFQGLNASSEYYGILGLPGNQTERSVAGGGRVWKSMNFTTQSG